MPSAFEQRFDKDYRRGLIGEDYVDTILESIARDRIEVKTDYRAAETGNVYIETWQLTASGEWKPSGIHVTEAEWYCLVGPLARGCIFISSADLKELARTSRETKMEGGEDTRSTKGRLVAVTSIIKTLFEGGINV
jgi:hypothetical protein